MLQRYNLDTEANYSLALREIIQNIALVGLWRGNFFLKAAFYGGTACRIFYGLDRYSEDLDFSLLTPDKTFSISEYIPYIISELNSYGISASFQPKRKSIESTVDSAFVKANTFEGFLKLEAPKNLIRGITPQQVLKLKVEIDTDPPGKFTTESKALLLPSTVSIQTYIPEDLFAGKVSALLCRMWKNRVKGRDWYDFVWFISMGTSLNLIHLESRIKQVKFIPQDKVLDKKLFCSLFLDRLASIDLDNAKDDVIKFIPDPDILSCWSKDYFRSLLDLVKFKP